jgi:hypothetical protein
LSSKKNEVEPEVKIKEKNTIDPIEAQAKADAIKWGMNPENEQETRTFAYIGEDGVYCGATITETFDWIASLFKAEISVVDVVEITKKPKWKTLVSLSITELIEYHRYLQRRKRIDFTLHEDTIRNEAIHNWMSNFLTLSVAVRGKSNRANVMLETIKDMGRPQQNPFGMLGSMLGDKSEKDMEFDGYPEDGAIED